MKGSKNYLDTSVLIAAVDEMHVHHVPCKKILSAAKKTNTYISQHVLAEFYAVLSGRKFISYLKKEQIQLMMDEITKIVSVVEIGSKDYFEIINIANSNNIRGGAVYDAIHMYAAKKINAKNIYTLNTKDFIRVMPEIAVRVKQP